MSSYLVLFIFIRLVLVYLSVRNKEIFGIRVHGLIPRNSFLRALYTEGYYKSALTKDIYKLRDIYKTRDIYKLRGIYKTRGIYKLRSIYKLRGIYKTRDIYKLIGIYKTRGIYKLYNMYKLRVSSKDNFIWIISINLLLSYFLEGLLSNIRTFVYLFTLNFYYYLLSNL